MLMYRTAASRVLRGGRACGPVHERGPADTRTRTSSRGTHQRPRSAPRARARTRAGCVQAGQRVRRPREVVEHHLLRSEFVQPSVRAFVSSFTSLGKGRARAPATTGMAERNSVDDLEWVKIGDSQEGDGHEDDEVPLDDLSPAQLRELVLAGRKRVADLKLSIQVNCEAGRSAAASARTHTALMLHARRAGSGQADQGAQGALVGQGAQGAQRGAADSGREPVCRGGAGARARGALENVCPQQDLLHILRAWGLCALPPDEFWVCVRPEQLVSRAVTPPARGVRGQRGRKLTRARAAPSLCGIVPVISCRNFIAFNRGCPFRYLSDESLSAARANSAGKVEYVIGHVLSPSRHPLLPCVHAHTDTRERMQARPDTHALTHARLHTCTRYPACWFLSP